MSLELERPERRFILRGGNAEAAACQDREMLVESGAGTGKSYGLLVQVLLATKYPDARILLLRKSRVSLNVVLDDWENEILYPGHPALGANPPHFTGRSRPYTFPNGAEVWLGGIDKPDKWMSSKWDRIFVFEATDGVTLRDWQYMLTRLRNFATPYHQLAADCNPKHSGHWLNRRAEQPYQMPDDLELVAQMPPARPGQTQITRIRVRHQDNPMLWDNEGCKWWPRGVEYMSTLHALTGHDRDRLLLHKWVAAEGLVYGEYDPEVHVVAAECKQNEHGNWAIFHNGREHRVHRFSVGGDRGWTHAGSLLLFAVDVEGRMWLVEQVHHTRKMQSWWSDHLYRWWENYGIWRGWFDSSEPEWITHLNDRIGVKEERDAYRVIRKANKAVQTGINELKERLAVQEDGLPRFLILSDSLKHTPDPALRDKFLPYCIEMEFESYSWKAIPDGKDFGRDEPEKEGDDSLDAARYAVMGLYNRDKELEVPVVRHKSVYEQDIEDALGF